MVADRRRQGATSEVQPGRYATAQPPCAQNGDISTLRGLTLPLAPKTDGLLGSRACLHPRNNTFIRRIGTKVNTGEETMSEPDHERRDFIRKTGAAAGVAALATTIGGQSAAAADVVELNRMGPTPEQIQQFLSLPDRPVVMVNLLKFKEGTGAQEYGKYGQAMQTILKGVGAEILFSGQCQMTLIGGAEWDVVALVRYPNARALIEMSQSAVYQEAHVHRAEGLAGQVNLALFEG